MNRFNENFPQQAPWLTESRIKSDIDMQVVPVQPTPPVSPEEEEAFSDQALNDNGFLKNGEVWSKSAFPFDSPPINMRNASIESMTIPPYKPRTGYLRTAPSLSPRAELLREAEQLITGERNITYGEPTTNFSNIAALFNIQFGHMLKEGHQFTGAHIAQAMIHIKQARLIAQPKRDSYLDIAGYAALGWEVENDA